MKAKKAGKSYDQLPNGMTEERIARLEEIGFEWSVSDKVFVPGSGVPWDSRFEELKAYKEKYGTCHVPKVKDGPYKQLGRLGWYPTNKDIQNS